jgi:hypothetical protein
MTGRFPGNLRQVLAEAYLILLPGQIRSQLAEQLGKRRLDRKCAGSGTIWGRVHGSRCWRSSSISACPLVTFTRLRPNVPRMACSRRSRLQSHITSRHQVIPATVRPMISVRSARRLRPWRLHWPPRHRYCRSNSPASPSIVRSNPFLRSQSRRPRRSNRAALRFPDLAASMPLAAAMSRFDRRGGVALADREHRASDGDRAMRPHSRREWTGAMEFLEERMICNMAMIGTGASG